MVVRTASSVSLGGSGFAPPPPHEIISITEIRPEAAVTTPANPGAGSFTLVGSDRPSTPSLPNIQLETGTPSQDSQRPGEAELPVNSVDNFVPQFVSGQADTSVEPELKELTLSTYEASLRFPPGQEVNFGSAFLNSEPTEEGAAKVGVTTPPAPEVFIPSLPGPQELVSVAEPPSFSRNNVELPGSVDGDFELVFPNAELKKVSPTRSLEARITVTDLDNDIYQPLQVNGPTIFVSAPDTATAEVDRLTESEYLASLDKLVPLDNTSYTSGGYEQILDDKIAEIQKAAEELERLYWGGKEEFNLT